MQLTLNFPKLIAHRGASAYAPENTLAAMHKAKKLGATWVEFDVRLTSCGTVIVFHDEILNRTTNDEGLVINTSYEKIQQLDAGSWFANEFIGEKVPTFEAMLKTLAELKLGMNVELKPTPTTEIALVEKTLMLLKNNWPVNLPAPLISSFSLLSLQTVKALAPELPIGLLLSNWKTGWEEQARNLACSSININLPMVSKEKIKEAQKIVPYVLCYTVNQTAQATDLFNMGIDAIFSDFPDLLINNNG